jgi:copper chaperone CopZ
MALLLVSIRDWLEYKRSRAILPPMFRLIPHRALSEPKAAVASVREEDGRSTATLHIEGFVCSACAANVERHLRAVEGVESARVDLDSGEACVVYNTAEASPDALVQAVEGAVWFPRARRVISKIAGRASARRRQAEACPTE